jgi:methyltransferase
VTSAAWYGLFVAAIAIERLAEVVYSGRNVRRAIARGGVEEGARHYPAMVALHAALLASSVAEVWLLQRPWIPLLGVPMLAVVGAAMALRYWVIASLDGRWTTRVVYVPGDALVTTGPFRWIRHPNYAAVAAEVGAIPLVHGAWLTAVAFSAGNACLLRRRIRVEEALIGRLAGGGQEKP